MKLNPDHKLAGLLVPVFAIRRDGDLGIGDTTAVKETIDWCAEHGFGVLQLLPITETGPDHSPYNAISALALDPTTITTTPDSLPGLSTEDFHRLTADTDTAGPVNYPRVKTLKQKLLRAAFHQAETPKSFLDANPWLDDYTLYRALLDLNGGNDNWETWPKEHRSPATARKKLGLHLREARRFYAFVQYIAHKQWLDVRRHAESRGVALMGDIPFGVSRTSADVWANRHLFDLHWSGGAPPEPHFQPDPFTAKWGQNWGIPLYRWNTHRREQFAWWKLRIRKTAEIFHLFRIDHVLGFYRIYAFPWLPRDNAANLNRNTEPLPRFFPHPDDTPAHKRINCRHGESLLKMIQLAAGDTVVVAEDLGVVPDYVRPNLLKLGIPGFKVPYWERNPDYTYIDGTKYPRLSVVTPATHDHEPLVVRWQKMWQAHDEASAKADHHNAHVTWLELQRFVAWAGLDTSNIPRDFTPQLHEAFCRRVLESNSWLAIFMVTDVFALPLRFNVPGSFADANWSARLPRPIRELDPEKAKRFALLIRESNRLPPRHPN
ncbi:MAG: 4-alpha-glucanotransferase [Verrucomicrobiae bacterium]|nr:4-alpha-glucanotransferase [Verrucomicrobiae bacterium]